MKIYEAGTIYIPVIATLIISMSPSSGYAKSPYTPDFSLPQSVTVTVIFLVSFFFGFITLYFCRCALENLGRNRNNQRYPAPQGDVGSNSGENIRNGLDPELIQAFPTFSYSTVKEFRREKYGLECAICLGEFKDDDMLRLLTFCCHVFHTECIDLWLESHKTCPVCRGELDEPRKSLEKSPLLLRSNSMHDIASNRSSLEDFVCIDIKDDSIDQKVDRDKDEAQDTSNEREQQQPSQRRRIERFSRSHWTFHN